MTGREENGIVNDDIVSPVTRRDGSDLFNRWSSVDMVILLPIKAGLVHLAH